MTDPSVDHPRPDQEELPPCLIRVDAEGRMWHKGAEMTHEGINNLLRSHVTLDEFGNYIITFNGQRCHVDVEDTFFVIKRLDADAEANGYPQTLWITLNDETKEILNPETLTQNPDNILYAKVKNGQFPARFLRPSYYQLAEHVREKDDRLVLTVDGRDYPLTF